MFFRETLASFLLVAEKKKGGGAIWRESLPRGSRALPCSMALPPRLDCNAGNHFSSVSFLVVLVSGGGSVGYQLP